MPHIRYLERKDHDQWLPLFQANSLHMLKDNVAKETWRRLTNPKEDVFGLGIFNEAEELLGFLHFILHPTTGFIDYACYMQDLYIDDKYRRQGYAKLLIWELEALGKEKQWNWIYWFADENNIAAQNLYKTLGIKMNFSLHMLQTKE